MNAAAHTLIDTFGRVHDNLRVSVTDRCNLRCRYCMPADNPVFMPRVEILTFEEIERLVRIAVTLGVRRVRLTGGEPLVRQALPDLVRRLRAVPGIDDLGLTTNGLLLPELARPLREAGLRRVNVHLDTLDRERFRRITARPGIERVIDGIDRCCQLGYDPVKLNAVVVRGVNEEDIVPLARFGREREVEVRFIEFMPLDASRRWERDRVVLAAEILERLQRGIGPLAPAPQDRARAPAVGYRFADGVGRIGIIASVSRPFCEQCDRVRLTADGRFRNCLFALDELDLKAMLRAGADDAEIAAALRGAIRGKWEGHEINAARFVQPERPMYAIGG